VIIEPSSSTLLSNGSPADFPPFHRAPIDPPRPIGAQAQISAPSILARHTLEVG
jgi:hypothetical protein